MSILSSLCLSPLISFNVNPQCTESKWDFFFLSSSRAWLIIQNLPEMTPNDPCVLLGGEKNRIPQNTLLAMIAHNAF